MSESQGEPSGLGDEESLSVLLAEDNLGDARLFEEYLSESPVEVDVRHEKTLRACLGALGEEKPDVLALDLGLPDSEGAETVKAAAAAAPEVPIVVLTGQDTLQAALDAQQAGAAEYLQKDELTPALAGRTLRWALRQSRMQEKLRQRDAWIRSITEGLSAGVFRTGPTGRIEYANEALAEMLGAGSEEELIGRDLTRFYADPTDRGKMLAEEGATGREVKLEGEGLEGEGGEELVGLLSAKPAYDQDGNPLHYDGTITDITGRAKRKKRLRMLSGAVEQAKESVLITEAEPLDEPGPRVEYVNAAYEEMTGYSQEEMKGKTPRVLQGPETDRDVLDSFREALEAGEEWEGETVNYRKDGTPYTVQWNIAPVRGTGGQIEHWVSVQRDVTDRQEREERLRRQRGLLEQAQRLAGAWEVDLDTGEASWSDEVYRIHEVEPGTDITSEEAIEFYASEARPRLREAFERCIEEEEPYDLELRVMTAEGNRRWVRTVGAPSKTAGGEVTKVAGALQDITERKEAEAELRRSRERYRSLFEDSTDAILVHDLEGRIQEANPQAETLFGREAEELEGQSIRDLHAPDEQETAREKLAALRVGESYQTVSRYQRADDSEFWGEISANATDVEAETVAHTLIRDVTEREETRQRLEHYREYTDRLLGAIDDLFFVFDGETRLRRWNGRVPEVTGYSEQELREMDALGFVPEGERERVAAQIADGFMTGHAQMEIPLLRKDGTTVPYEIAGNLVAHPEDGLRVVGIGRDITERKERERGLRRAKEDAEQAKEDAEKARREAEEARRMQSAFLANMSHEIRTPLTSIIGFAEALGAESSEMELPEGSALPKYASLIEKGGKRLLQTLEGVLNLSKLEAGQMELSEEAVDLAAQAHRAAEELGPDAQEKGIDLRREPREVSARADEGGIQIVLRNLLSNAIKYTREGGTVWVRTYREGGQAVLEVEDTGIGMEPEVADRLFEPFRQASEGFNREYEGTGVGLAVVDMAIEKMGGTIEYETEKGEGSRFTAWLPRAEDEDTTDEEETTDE